jgi:hypothetical protein
MREQIYERIQKRLPNKQWAEPLLEIAVDLLQLSPEEEKHLQDDWFNEYRSWWPTQQPVEIVLRHGLIQAISVANKDGALLPFDCYWLCGPPSVQVTACASAQQVTLLVITPPAPASDRLPEDFEGHTEVEEIYTARHRGRGPGEKQVHLDEDWIEFVQPIRT